MHIGLIGGIGPAATEHYYRCLIAAHEAAGKQMDLTIVHAEVRDLVQNMTDDKPDRQAAIFRDLVERLANTGAKAAAVTSMTGHFCIKQLKAISPLPILDALPAVDEGIAARGYRKVGLLGTHKVMGSRLYGAVTSADIVLPDPEDRDRTNDAYLAMATAARVTDEQRAVFFDVGARLCRDQGAEAVMLGGTDLFLAFDGRDCGFPVIDCAQLHVEAMMRKSIGSR